MLFALGQSVFKGGVREVEECTTLSQKLLQVTSMSNRTTYFRGDETGLVFLLVLWPPRQRGEYAP